MNGNLLLKFLGVFGDFTIGKPSRSTDLSYKDVKIKNSFQLWGRNSGVLNGRNPYLGTGSTAGSPRKRQSGLDCRNSQVSQTYPIARMWGAPFEKSAKGIHP